MSDLNKIRNAVTNTLTRLGDVEGTVQINGPDLRRLIADTVSLTLLGEISSEGVYEMLGVTPKKSEQAVVGETEVDRNWQLARLADVLKKVAREKQFAGAW